MGIPLLDRMVGAWLGSLMWVVERMSEKFDWWEVERRDTRVKE
jgi:hypothetical protein